LERDGSSKPEAATAVDKLLMMGMRMSETCWAVFKRQAVNLVDWCSWLVDLFEYRRKYAPPKRLYQKNRLQYLIIPKKIYIKFLHLCENLMLRAHKIETVYPQNEQISMCIIENFLSIPLLGLLWAKRVCWLTLQSRVSVVIMVADSIVAAAAARTVSLL
jgi:hypothetical protein